MMIVDREGGEQAHDFLYEFKIKTLFQNVADDNDSCLVALLGYFKNFLSIFSKCFVFHFDFAGGFVYFFSIRFSHSNVSVRNERDKVMKK